MKTEESCGGILFRKVSDKIEYLIIKHKEINGGHWDFPKGHVKEGESEEETAIREVLEETGLKMSILKGFKEKITYSPKEGVLKTVTFFLGKAADSRVSQGVDEIEDHQWLSYEDALKRLTFDNSRGLLAKAHKHIRERA